MNLSIGNLSISKSLMFKCDLFTNFGFTSYHESLLS